MKVKMQISMQHSTASLTKRMTISRVFLDKKPMVSSRQTLLLLKCDASVIDVVSLASRPLQAKKNSLFCRQNTTMKGTIMT